LPTLPVCCNHFTLGNPKQSFFYSIIHTDFRLLRYLRRNKLQLLYCSLPVYLPLFTAYYYLLSPILGYGQFFSLWSVIFKATNAIVCMLVQRETIRFHFVMTSAKEAMFYPAFVRLFVCVFVC